MKHSSFMLLLCAGILCLVSPANRLWGDDRSTPIERLLLDFSSPQKRDESGHILDGILDRLRDLAAKEHFQTAIHYLDQLEQARIGRTFSLFRSSRKQDEDAQLYKIRKFAADFYRHLAAFEKKREMLEEAEAREKEAKQYEAMIDRTLKILGTRSAELLPCFEDDLSTNPFSERTSASKLVQVPTIFYASFSALGGMVLPVLPPFSILANDEPTVDIALNPEWSWYLGSWEGVPETVVIGVSPVGHQVIWVAGQYTENRSVRCSRIGGRWVITAGEPVGKMPERAYPIFAEQTPAASSPVSTPIILKSRGFAGFTYRAMTPQDIVGSAPNSLEGVVIREVFPDTPAKKAGLEAGDVLVEYGHALVADESRMQKILPTTYAGDEIPVALWRQGKQVKTRLLLIEPPREEVADLDVEYTFFDVANARLRAVVVAPRGSAGKPLPGAFIVTALGSSRLRKFPGNNLSRELAYQLARQGRRVMRFELRGSGDSEGRDYRETDFQTEVEDNLAGLDFLCSRPDVDPRNVVVFGHSTGGIIAAILAGKRPTAGLIVSCTIGRSMVERVSETVRTQGILEGQSDQDVSSRVKDYGTLFAALGAKDALSDILKEHPELASYVNSMNRLMDDRTAQYWHQQINTRLSDIYAVVQVPTLILYNSCDFLTTRACHEWIEKTLVAAGNKQVTYRVVEQADHRYVKVLNATESFQTYRNSEMPLSPEPFRIILDWLAEIRPLEKK